MSLPRGAYLPNRVLLKVYSVFLSILTQPNFVFRLPGCAINPKFEVNEKFSKKQLSFCPSLRGNNHFRTEWYIKALTSLSMFMWHILMDLESFLTIICAFLYQFWTSFCLKNLQKNGKLLRFCKFLLTFYFWFKFRSLSFLFHSNLEEKTDLA